MEIEQQQVPTDDEFSRAFADFAAPASESTTTEPAANQPAEPVAAVEPAAAEPVIVAEEPAAAAPQDAAPVAEPAAVEPVLQEQAPAAPAIDGDAILDRLSKLVAEKAPAEPAPQPTVQAEPEAPVYSAEEQEFLANYDKDWSDVTKGEALKRRAEYKTLLNHVFKEVADYFKPHLEMLEAVAERTHLSDIRGKVTDYDQVRDNVLSWVEQQPKYLQGAYQQVIQYGTVDEVADLIDRYRRDAGVSGGTPAAPAKKVSELPDATKKAAAALAPVQTKRSTIAVQEDPQDFAAAFERFAKAASR